jgi:hypothetical protein
MMSLIPRQRSFTIQNHKVKEHWLEILQKNFRFNAKTQLCRKSLQDLILKKTTAKFSFAFVSQNQWTAQWLWIACVVTFSLDYT